MNRPYPSDAAVRPAESGRTVLYLDLPMGAAGDMLTAALLELFPDPAAMVDRLNGLGLPGVRYEAAPAETCSVRGTHVTVRAFGAVEEAGEDHDHGHHHDHDHEHPHDHHHDHHHEHHAYADVQALLASLALPEAVREDAQAVYARLAAAESAVHGVPVTDIHFHEVGTVDAVADVAAVCWLIRALAPDVILASPVTTGFGSVRCAHGILPVPAPATARLLTGLPIRAGDIEGELCTPTGAALIAHFAQGFGPMPALTPRAWGCGCGTKVFAKANCVRAVYGDLYEEPAGRDSDFVTLLSCEIDDMTGEELGFACERLLEAGALDVHTAPVFMKKQRPGTALTVLCRLAEADALTQRIFRLTTTLGVRRQTAERTVLPRRLETRETPAGPVREKIADTGNGQRSKLEYEDLARIARAHDISLRDAARMAGKQS